MSNRHPHPNPRKGQRNKLALFRVVRYEVVKRIDGWRKCGPFWIPDKRKVKP